MAAQSFAVAVIHIFLGEIDNLHQTSAKLFEDLSLRYSCIVVIFLAIVRLRNDTLNGGLDDIRCDEIARPFSGQRRRGG